MLVFPGKWCPSGTEKYVPAIVRWISWTSPVRGQFSEPWVLSYAMEICIYIHMDVYVNVWCKAAGCLGSQRVYNSVTVVPLNLHSHPFQSHRAVFRAPAPHISPTACFYNSNGVFRVCSYKLSSPLCWPPFFHVSAWRLRLFRANRQRYPDRSGVNGLGEKVIITGYRSCCFFHFSACLLRYRHHGTFWRPQSPSLSLIDTDGGIVSYRSSEILSSS